MEGELWRGLYRVVMEVGKTVRSGRVQYSNAAIVLVFLWSVLHDRPVSWACDRRSWPVDWYGGLLPSSSTMSRRLRTASVQALLDAVLSRINGVLPRAWIRYLDAKPLIIGGASGDPDAGFGRAAGGTMAKGYKLHVIRDAGGALEAWDVRPIHVNEQEVAHTLIPRLRGVGFLIADNGYDANDLYEEAHAYRHQLVAPRRRSAKALGHKRHSVARLRAVAMIADGVARPLLLARRGIERSFGSQGNYPGGLGPLPNWVRRLSRVQRWVHAKLIIDSLRVLRNKRLAA